MRQIIDWFSFQYGHTVTVAVLPWSQARCDVLYFLLLFFLLLLILDDALLQILQHPDVVGIGLLGIKLLALAPASRIRRCNFCRQRQ